VDQIIKRFSERESEFRLERSNYTYTQTFSIQTIDEDDRPDGEYRMTSEIVFTPDANDLKRSRTPRRTRCAASKLSEQDLDDVRNVQPFVLNSEDLPKYNVTYVGRQQVDELSCYIFDVAPKTIEKKQRYFSRPRVGGRQRPADRDVRRQSGSRHHSTKIMKTFFRGFAPIGRILRRVSGFRCIREPTIISISVRATCTFG